MATVKINTGQVRSAEGVADNKLQYLTNDWSSLTYIQFPDDCRGLLQIVKETEEYKIWSRMGYESVGDFYQKELLLQPDHIVKAVEWLEANPEDVVGFDKAIERFEKAKIIHTKRAEGMTQQAIADELGIHQTTVGDILREKPGAPQKTLKPKRIRIEITIGSGTLPENAAMRIRERLGDDYAEALADALRKA